jgi:hypothetical protein
MPKLNAQMVKAVDSADSSVGSYALIEPGRYFAKLSNVEVKDGNHGGTQWSCEFNEIQDVNGQRIAGRQWLNLNLPVAGAMPASYTNGEDKWQKYQAVSAARLKQFFESFGYTTDSDTDEMIGETAVIEIEIRTIQNGPRRGEQVNGIKSIHPATKLGSGAPASEDDTF